MPLKDGTEPGIPEQLFFLKRGKDNEPEAGAERMTFEGQKTVFSSEG